ncbi:hypothetical protein [Antarctobacter heliothermus]|uniref:Clp protease n=1 Tax=Antarctobacter heliothermus TaxID=74033 RepID=A0A239GNG9_9RHOB|nr:hypothetical protein [Antarctobacter heliothermus]SNS70707.1 hypothetical protein SAMN04488078_10287 [Antarctobacter heliothermus]
MGAAFWCLVSPLEAVADVTQLDDRTIRITGEFDARLVDEFRAVVARTPNVATVELHSLGGRVYSGLEIARIINDLRLNTWITAGSECHSACSIAFLAGELRLADGLLGVHQVSGVNDDSLTQSVISDVFDALRQFGTPDALVSRMLRTPPDDIYVFSTDELEDLGINRRSGDVSTEDLHHLQVLTSTLNRDWLTGTFLNTHTLKPFFSMESRSLDPVFRIVYYPHSGVSFGEVIWENREFPPGQTDLTLVFERRGEEPVWARIRADVERNGYAFDLPADGASGLETFFAAFAYAHEFGVEDFAGRTIVDYSLAGSLRATEQFMTLLRQR